MKVEYSRAWLFPAVCLVITGYFVFHSIQGSRGYRRMHQVEQEIILARHVAEETRAERDLLKNKVQALSSESLDLDQLEESALHILNMGPPDDQVISLNR